MIDRLSNQTIKTVIFSTFLFILLIQNTIALLIVSLFQDINVAFIFYFRDVFLVMILLCTLFTRQRYAISITDKLIMVLILLVVISFIMNVSTDGLDNSIYKLRFYLFPLLTFFIGKQFLYDMPSAKIKSIFVVSVLAIISVSFFYLLCDNNKLVDMNITKVFIDKGSDPELLKQSNGLPMNYYSYYGTYQLKRAFGLLFDPLSLGFFLVPFLFYYRYKVVHNKLISNYLIYLLLLLLIVLTQTRAIILAYLLVSLIIRFKKESYEIRGIKLLFVLLVSVAIGTIIFYKPILDILDPSSRAHVVAYHDAVNKIMDAKLLNTVFGQSYYERDQFGNESLYTTMIIQNGILYFFIFNYFIYKNYINLKKNINCGMNLIILSSLIVYYLASFTTEHWFAVTSSSIFWLLLGICAHDMNGNKQEKIILSK